MDLRVAMTAYRRPDYLARTLDSWLEVPELGQIPLTVSVDPSDRSDRIVNLLFEFSQRRRNVRCLANKRRLGVLVNPWDAIDREFEEGAQFVVLAEDDVLVSPDCLRYFAWAAEHFAERDDCLVVCGFRGIWSNSQFAHGRRLEPVEAAPFAFLDEWFSPLLWGTWRDRWYGANGFPSMKRTWDKDYSTGGPGKVQAGWDWNLRLRVMPPRKAVFPMLSRSQHIGEHGGAHMLPKDFADSQSSCFLGIPYFGPYEEIR